ncbi:MAG: nuclear transport factor 2 family protein [Alphaproteobacteria bacterium]|jgi:ketosteroid isomerase-like protein|nr:nuclear transport factor 2 family protein [Alphaproteobacteria bacterium]
MTQHEMIELVKRYFHGVDNTKFEAIAETLTDDCVFSVETHGVKLQGVAEIEGMFLRLWASFAAVKHQDFIYVADPGQGRIAARFAVVNTHHDGSLTNKSNCNFFELRDGRFSRIAVYMAGENTLTPTLARISHRGTACVAPR